MVRNRLNFKLILSAWIQHQKFQIWAIFFNFMVFSKNTISKGQDGEIELLLTYFNPVWLFKPGTWSGYDTFLYQANFGNVMVF